MAAHIRRVRFPDVAGSVDRVVFRLRAATARVGGLVIAGASLRDAVVSEFLARRRLKSLSL